MDVILEEVVELIGEGVDGAIDRFGGAVAEGEWCGGLFACREGDELEFSQVVRYLRLSVYC